MRFPEFTAEASLFPLRVSYGGFVTTTGLSMRSVTAAWRSRWEVGIRQCLPGCYYDGLGGCRCNYTHLPQIVSL
jgi:hypothetical protein